MHIGDIIIFSEKHNNNNKISTKIINLFRYSTFKEILDTFNIETLADKSISKQTLLDDLNKFYTKEDQIKYGVLGIQIKPLDNEVTDNEQKNN